MNAPEFIVVGTGAMGAAISYELARRGAAVLGLDAYTPPHALGSTHGRSRIIREAYYEHPLYVPLVQRAFELWQELEELTGTVLYRRTGGLMVGDGDGALLRGTLDSVRTHALPHELLDADAIRRRFPGLLPEPAHVGVLEERAGMLMPDSCVRTMLRLAHGHGAELRSGTRVDAWNADGDDIVLHTTGGTLRAPHVIFAAGPWLGRLLTTGAQAPLVLPLRVERQVSHWFAPAPGAHVFGADACPIALWEHAPGRILYTFPHDGLGVKAGIHHEGAFVDPDAADRSVSLDEESRVRTLLERFMPGAGHTAVHAEVCLYTNTPDAHFVIDAHPHHDNVMLVSSCSGHGFKFAAVIGEIVAEALLEGGSRFELEPFAVSRLLD